MQQRMGNEVINTKEGLTATAKERDQVLDELKEMRKMAQEANMKLDESARKNMEISLELKSAEKCLSDASGKIKAKEKDVQSLKVELSDKESDLCKLSEDLNNAKISEAQMKSRIQELETEVKKGKNSEVIMHDSLVAQTDQLEQTKMLLQESKLEIASLQQKIENLENSPKYNKLKSTVPRSCPEESSELSSLKRELKLAVEAEEYSKRAMDDLALVLKEVSTEANQVKEKLSVTEPELEHVKEEANQYKEQLSEAKIEIERHKNTIKRLRLEAEDSLLAWNGRETGFVDCVRRADEEKTILQEENSRLQEMLKEAETKSKQSKEENNKLRDILKQALNESSMAKEVASIAKEENSQLKDSLQEMDEQLNNLARENECLKDNEAAAFENIKELKRMIFEASSNQEGGDSQGRKLKKHNTMNKDGKGSKKLYKAFSFNLKDLKMHNKHKDEDKEPSEEDYSNENPDPLKGSIFDLDSPDNALRRHSTKNHPALSDNLRIISSDDLDNSRRRRLLRKFGNILIGRSFYKKEPTPSPDGFLHR